MREQQTLQYALQQAVIALRRAMDATIRFGSIFPALGTSKHVIHFLLFQVNGLAQLHKTLERYTCARQQTSTGDMRSTHLSINIVYIRASLAIVSQVLNVKLNCRTYDFNNCRSVMWARPVWRTSGGGSRSSRFAQVGQYAFMPLHHAQASPMVMVESW